MATFALMFSDPFANGEESFCRVDHVAFRIGEVVSEGRAQFELVKGGNIGLKGYC